MYMDLVSNIKDIYGQWRVGASVFTMIPGRGGRLVSWDIDLPKGKRRVLYCPDLGEEVVVGGGSQVLFPFVGRSTEGKKIDSWKGPGGEVLRMPYNGFGQDAEYRIVSRDEMSVTLELVQSGEMEEYYPFRYNFRVSYRFFELGVEVTLELENRDEVSIPWCGGVAFDLGVPWHEGHMLGSYQVWIPAKKAFYQGSSGELVAVKEFKEFTSLDDPYIMDRIHTRLKANEMRLGPKGDEESITVSIGRDMVPGFFNGIKLRKDEEGRYCRVEVGMGLPNAQEHKKGLFSVLPGDKESFIVFLNLL